MSLENYCAVHSSRCYLLCTLLAAGIGTPLFSNSCLCCSIGHHGSERRHTSEHCAFHAVWQDDIADQCLQRLRYVMRSRDMSQPQHDVHWIGEMQKIWTTKLLLKTLDRVKNKSRTQCPSKNRGAFFSLHFPSPDHWILVSVVSVFRWSTEKSLEPCVGFLHYSYIGKVEYTPPKCHE